MELIKMLVTDYDQNKGTATVRIQTPQMKMVAKLPNVRLRGFISHRLKLEASGKADMAYTNRWFICDNKSQRTADNPFRLTAWSKGREVVELTLQHVKDMCCTRKITDMHNRVLKTNDWLTHSPAYYRRFETVETTKS